MNKRVKELAAQAEEEIKAEYEDESRRNRRLYNEIFLPKFAELIVKKCMHVAKYHTPDTEECEHTWLIHDKIKEYFGVEE